MRVPGLSLLLLIALAVLPAAAQADSSFGRFHALVIGNQNYRHLTTLQTPLADANAVAEVLKTQYGFTVDLLLDKSRDEIKLALSELRKTMTNERDSLLIYYAGHGYLDNVTGTGYWQPVDAEQDNDVYWLPTDEISRLLKAVRVRHVLIVADSCYSGSLLMRDSGARLPAAASRDEWLKRMQAKRSRTALTSGGEEPVADGGGSGHSVFAKALLEVLRENKEILDGDSLFDRIKRPVILNADQTPLYGDIKMTGHEMGDFLLVPKEMQAGGIQEQPERKADLDFLKRDNEGDVDNISLYYQIGGEKAIEAIVEIFYDKILADGRVNGFFKGVDMNRQRRMQKDFLMFAFGGPNNYQGRDLRTAHTHLVRNGLNDIHFTIVIEHLISTMNELGMKEKLIMQAADVLNSVRKHVLNK